MIIGPGETATLSARLRGHPGLEPGNAGRIALVCEDEERFLVVIPVRVLSVAGLTVLPPLVDFGAIHRHQLPARRNVYVIPEDAAQSVQKVLWESSCDWMSVDAVKMPPGSPKRVFTVRIKENAPAGRIAARLTFRLAAESQHGMEELRKAVTVTANVLSSDD